MTFDLKLTTSETLEVVLSCDPAVEGAWTLAERTAWTWQGKPPKTPPPEDATRFILRPLSWAERRALGQARPLGCVSQRGAELYSEQIGRYVLDAKRKARKEGDDPDEGDDGRSVAQWHGDLNAADRVELDRYVREKARSEEAACAAAVVEVRTGGRSLLWGAFLDAIRDDNTVASIIHELALHARRLSSLTPDAGKS